MKTIGFVGTAKNTGKTTTALHVLKLVSEAGIVTALTSIGYDGENTDHITGLPKPRYYAAKGMLLATAEPCLGYGSAKLKDPIRTGLRTILGEIIIATVAEPGYVVLAGPNRRMDIQQLLATLESLGVALTMVDGALNRLAALTVADGLVLSTGAAYDERIPELAAHAAAIESLFHYPKYSSEETSHQVSFIAPTGITQQLALGSVLEASAMQAVADWLKSSQGGTCLIPGVFSPQLFQEMLQQLDHHLEGSRFVFQSPLNLLAAGSPEIWQAGFASLKSRGGEVLYQAPLPLYLMTVNPFYPQYLQKTGNYTAAFVDKVALLQRTRQLIQDTPVVDILQPPLPDLLKICEITPDMFSDRPQA